MHFINQNFIISSTIYLISYIFTGYTFTKVGKWAGIKWAWISWIPNGSAFLIAKIANWRLWALFPIFQFVNYFFYLIEAKTITITGLITGF